MSDFEFAKNGNNHSENNVPELLNATMFSFFEAGQVSGLHALPTCDQVFAR